MKNKGFVIINIMALAFGIIFLRDFYRPNCAGATCIKWPTLEMSYGQNSGWGGSNASPTGLPESGYAWDLYGDGTSHNNEAPFLAGMSVRSLGENDDGAYCWGSNDVNPGWSWTYYESDGWTNNDKAWCIYNWFGWQNYYP
jgi:hypothetical protein